MKLVREILYEKFTQDSDPIDDLEIGMMHQIKRWAEAESGYVYVEEDLLWICAKYGKTEFVKYLLEKGADVHAENDRALRSASDNGHDKVVKLLLDAGADVHASNDYALQWSSTYGHNKVVKLLLDAGADVHAEKDAALRWASYNGHVDVVKVLLDAGANVHALNDAALQHASKNGHDKVVKILKDHITKEKKLKESLNEKFTQDSDPISDMGIGGYSYETLKPGAVIRAKRIGIAVTRNRSGRFTDWKSGEKLWPEQNLVIYLIKSFGEGYTRIYFLRVYKEEDTSAIINVVKNNATLLWFKYSANNMIVSKRMFNNKFEVIERGF